MTTHSRTTTETVTLIQSLPQSQGRTVGEVEELHQRSLCYRLRYVDGGSVFVKRAQRAASGSWTADVVREAKILQLLHGLGAPVPRHLATVDKPDFKAMVTEYLDDRSPVATGHLLDNGGVAWADALGRTVAQIHALSARLGPVGTGIDQTPPTLNLVSPLVARIRRPTPSEVAAHAGGYSEMLTRLHLAGLDEALATTVDGWRADGLIHGDLKSDNLLRSRDVDDDEPISVIDWEFAGWGDTRWDVASLIGACVFEWLNGVICQSNGTLDDWLADAHWPLGAVRRAVRQLTAAYSTGGVVTDNDRAQWMRYAGLFLLQRLMMSAMHSPRLTSSALTYLQVATTILRDPSTGIELLT